MAIEIDETGRPVALTGIPLRLTVAAGYVGVLERSLTTATGFTEVRILPTSTGAAVDVVDVLPGDNVTRFYRLRARRADVSDSTASSEVSDVPRLLG